MTAAALAAAVRARRTTAREAVEAALAAIARHDRALCAFTAVLAGRARARAAALDDAVARGEDPGPLAGVPFAAKNLFDAAGVVTRAGANIMAGNPPAMRDADAVEALERAGAILVGLTNMDEFAYGFVTVNAHDGTTRNPHDLDRIAGGSSGGSAAAVAAGVVPLSLGSDTNGSIRVPAALCGIFGLRPTYGTLSRRGAFPFAGSLDTVGPFARTAADLALACTALEPAFAPAGAARPRVARLGGFFDAGLSAQARAAVARVAAAAGASAVVELADAARARQAAFVITAAEGGELHAQRLREHAADFDPATRDRLAAGALMPAAWYVRAQRFRAAYRTAIAEAFGDYDVLLAPATPYAATLAGQKTIEIDGVTSDVRPNLGVFTQPITLTGYPVVAVPVVEPGALPVGVQLIGRPGSEPLLLALAAELERVGAAGAGPVPGPA